MRPAAGERGARRRGARLPERALPRGRLLIAILGDTHLPRGARRLPARCLELLRAASLVVHTGDLVSSELLEQLRKLGPPLAAVHGNVDEPAVRLALPARLEVEAEGLRVGVVHSGGASAGRHERLRAWFPACDAIAYGHSHRPEIARSEGVWILNPGSATDRRRAPTHTMILLGGGTPELVDLGP